MKERSLFENSILACIKEKQEELDAAKEEGSVEKILKAKKSLNDYIRAYNRDFSAGQDLPFYE